MPKVVAKSLRRLFVAFADLSTIDDDIVLVRGVVQDAQRIDVNREIALIAGVGRRNVAKVRTILKLAHPRLIEALRDRILTINHAHELCKLPRSGQLEQFARDVEKRETAKIIRRYVRRPEQRITNLDTASVLRSLQEQEAKLPGSIVVQAARLAQTVVLVGEDLSLGTDCQSELKMA